METLKTENDVLIEYPKGCDNAPKKFFIIKTVAAAMDEDDEFLSKAVAGKAVLPEPPGGIEKITLESIITHGKDAAFECVVYFRERSPVEAGVFITFKSAGKNIIVRTNVFHKKAER